ncbi:MAG TPA: penicillin-binding protein activator [Casimicrobiaceae bacterium]|nr:penicillin-binding protein activator [Casimicrobiaceae bacterium]
MPTPMHESNALRCAAQRILRAGIVVALTAGALSCAYVGPATRAPIVERQHALGHPAAEGPPAAAAPAGTPGQEGAVAAGLAQPPAAGMAGPGATAVGPGAASPAADAIPPPPTSDLIALILPLDVPEYARVAAAVRDGFVDAADAAGAKDRVVVMPHGVDGVIPAFESALRRGVRVAVGPLVRDDLKTLAISGAQLPWTLALNQLEDASPLPRAIYTFPLSVDSDARMIAKRARQDGAHSIDVVDGDSPLMRRLATGFARTWVADGGSAPADLPFDATPDALTRLRSSLAKAPPDAMLLAMSSEHAALVKPFLGDITTYASGLIFDRPSIATAHDLDGVRVVEIPWLLTPDAPAFAALKPPEAGGEALARLYAFGFDAYRIASAYHAEPPGQFDLDGATGHISLEGRQFVREGALGVYRDGQLVPLEPAP